MYTALLEHWETDDEVTQNFSSCVNNTGGRNSIRVQHKKQTKQYIHSTHLKANFLYSVMVCDV